MKELSLDPTTGISKLRGQTPVRLNLVDNSIILDMF
jgi:hypothetical protein